MFYILDDLGYIEDTSSHYIEKDEKTCTEYTGTIPEGYDSLDDWVLNANIRAYKIVGGNLTYDADRDAELQEEYNKNPNAWISLTPKKGTWEFLEYRKIGNRVFIRGRATAYKWETDSEIIADVPEEITPLKITYSYSHLSSGRIGRVGVNANGVLFYDWAKNISDASNYTTSNWLFFSFNYFLD